MDKKAQQLLFGSIFFLFVFFLVVTIFFNDLFAHDDSGQQRFDLLSREAVRLADNLVRTGYPSDWDENDVERIGLTTEGGFDQAKLDMLNDLRSQGYDQLKPLLGVQYDYAISISKDDTFIAAPGITEEDLAANPPRYLARQKRTIYEGPTPITITVYSYTD